MSSLPLKHNVFILNKHKSWILEGLVRESATKQGLKVKFSYLPYLKREYFFPQLSRNIFHHKKANCEIYVHHQILDVVKGRHLEGNSQKRLLLTHFEPAERVPINVLKFLSRWERILVQNQAMKNQLVEKSPLDIESKIVVYYGAIDRSVYFPNSTKRRGGIVLIVGDCKPRKNPGLVREVIKHCKDIKFVIHGYGWEDYLDVHNKKEFPNLEYRRFSLENNPSLMREASILLSLSTIEGGPIPLLEALASGTKVICTNTGFAKEIVRDNMGIVLSTQSTAAEISYAIRDCLHNLESRECDLLNGRFTWRELAEKIYL